MVRPRLQGTQFAFSVQKGQIAVTCPWGNRMICHMPDARRFGPVSLGMPYIEIDTAPGTADGIARFYRDIIGNPAGTGTDDRGRFARIPVGLHESLIFRETDRELPPFDGHHIQIALADFSGAHRRLQERGLITEESNQHQYRFEDIVDPETGAKLASIEHEVRSMRHPMYARALVNRNPLQTNNLYAPGHESLAWSLPAADDLPAR
jgi:hypothetical protein